MAKRLHIYYSGSVQGVGFRFAAERSASALGLNGWAKNLSDGRVEAVLEGEEAALKGFIAKMSDIFKGYIKDEEVLWEKPSGEFTYFDIRA